MQFVTAVGIAANVIDDTRRIMITFIKQIFWKLEIMVNGF